MIDAEFKRAFSATPDITLFTPGRVNLIGEHTDYNGGRVLPTALPLGITLALSPRRDGKIRIWSDEFSDKAERHMSDEARDHWSDYVVGSLKLAHLEGFGPFGADIAATTSLPVGAGLSSSAAVTVGLLRAVQTLADHALSDTQLAVLARRVENDYIGMPCGIMDQMAVALARPGQALSLDTTSLAYTLIDLPDTHKMAVIHSGTFRQLNEGRYKIRKEECDAIKAVLGHADLCLVTDAELVTLANLPAPLLRRAKHCASEHRRTIRATEALKAGRMKAFGKLMDESHISMRDDFEISTPSVDALVADAQSFGAVGARLTGGGFGGCIVACVEIEKLESWRAALLQAHPDAFWVC